MGVTDIIQSVGIIITLMLAIWQMRVQSRQVEASADLALMLKFDDINKLFIDHPGLWKLLDGSYTTPPSSEAEEKMETILFIVFNTLELAYRHYRKHGLMQGDDWPDWEKTIDAYVRKPYVKDWWATNGSEFSAQFSDYVKAKITKVSL